jgi:hypothetical protein
MTDEEREEFNAIVSAEADFYQMSFLNGILKHNDRHRSALMERCSIPAVCRFWKRSK